MRAARLARAVCGTGASSPLRGPSLTVTGVSLALSVPLTTPRELHLYALPLFKDRLVFLPVVGYKEEVDTSSELREPGLRCSMQGVRLDWEAFIARYCLPPTRARVALPSLATRGGDGLNRCPCIALYRPVQSMCQLRSPLPPAAVMGKMQAGVGNVGQSLSGLWHSLKDKGNLSQKIYK